MTLLLLYLLYPCSPMLLPYDFPSNLLTLLCCCCCFHWSCIICRTLLPRSVDCDWCLPVPPLYPYAPADVFSLLLLLLLSLLRGRYSLLPLPVVVSDTRCWCAAGVLRCCCWGPPIFRYSFPWNHPTPLFYPVLRYFLFVPPNSRLFRHSYTSITCMVGDLFCFFFPPALISGEVRIQSIITYQVSNMLILIQHSRIKVGYFPKISVRHEPTVPNWYAVNNILYKYFQGVRWEFDEFRVSAIFITNPWVFTPLIVLVFMISQRGTFKVV